MKTTKRQRKREAKRARRAEANSPHQSLSAHTCTECRKKIREGQSQEAWTEHRAALEAR